MLIEREGVEERGAALAAEEFRFEGTGLRKAGGTNGNAGEITEGLPADPALIGQDDVKEARSKGLKPVNGPEG